MSSVSPDTANRRGEKVGAKYCIKLAKGRRRGYVRTGKVMSLTHYFSETNGKDIRMVYNGTLRILNSSLWEPHFALPTVGSTLWAVERGTFIAECDIGEIFSNLC